MNFIINGIILHYLNKIWNKSDGKIYDFLMLHKEEILSGFKQVGTFSPVFRYSPLTTNLNNAEPVLPVNVEIKHIPGKQTLTQFNQDIRAAIEQIDLKFVREQLTQAGENIKPMFEQCKQVGQNLKFVLDQLAQTINSTALSSQFTQVMEAQQKFQKWLCEASQRCTGWC